MQKQGKLKVETLIETARTFRKKYPLTPATACSAMSDYTDRQGRTVWFNSRYYRTSVLWEGDRMGIRDIHLFDENVESYYLKNVCTSNECIYMALPIVDGCLWSTAADMASLRFYAISPDGQTKELRGGEPVIAKTKGGMKVRWPLKDVEGEIVLQMSERRLTARCTNRNLAWCMMLNVQPDAKLPFLSIGTQTLTASQEGYPYRLTLRRGTFDDMRGLGRFVFSIHPQGGKVEMNCVAGVSSLLK